MRPWRLDSFGIWWKIERPSVAVRSATRSGCNSFRIRRGKGPPVGWAVLPVGWAVLPVKECEVLQVRTPDKGCRQALLASRCAALHSLALPEECVVPPQGLLDLMGCPNRGWHRRHQEECPLVLPDQADTVTLHRLVDLWQRQCRLRAWLHPRARPRREDQCHPRVWLRQPAVRHLLADRCLLKVWPHQLVLRGLHLQDHQWVMLRLRRRVGQCLRPHQAPELLLPHPGIDSLRPRGLPVDYHAFCFRQNK